MPVSSWPGAQTLLGAAIRDALRAAGFRNIVGEPPDEPDLTDAGQVEDFFGEARPEYVFLAGRQVRRHPAQPDAAGRPDARQPARRHERPPTPPTNMGVSKLLYLASSCCYPEHAAQPLRVESLGAGPLEPTSEAYATAKLAGLRLCQAYRRQYGVRFLTAIPADAFGPHDDFSPDSGHVIPALMRRAHEAKRRGEPQLDRLGHGDAAPGVPLFQDLADACLFVMRPLRRRGADQPRRRRGPVHRRGRPRRRGRGRLPGPARLRRRQAGRHAAEAARFEPNCSPWAGGRPPISGRPRPRRTTGFCNT